MAPIERLSSALVAQRALGCSCGVRRAVICSFEDAEEFALARPDARLVLLRDAALLPNEERGATFNEPLIGFLRDLGR